MAVYFEVHFNGYPLSKKRVVYFEQHLHFRCIQRVNYGCLFRTLMYGTFNVYGNTLGKKMGRLFLIGSYILMFFHIFKAVLRIHDILLRIRISGYRPLTYGSGSCYFRHWPSRRQQKTNLKKGFSACYFLKVHLHHFSKIKSKKVTKQ